MIGHEVIIQRIEVHWAGRWVVSCHDSDIRFADAAWHSERIAASPHDDRRPCLRTV
jgi:hypothetical protein